MYQNQIGETGLATLDDTSPSFGPLDGGSFGARSSVTNNGVRGANEGRPGVITHASVNTMEVALEINADSNLSDQTQKSLNGGEAAALSFRSTARQLQGPRRNPVARNIAI